MAVKRRAFSRDFKLQDAGSRGWPAQRPSGSSACREKRLHRTESAINRIVPNSGFFDAQAKTMASEVSCLKTYSASSSFVIRWRCSFV